VIGGSWERSKGLQSGWRGFRVVGGASEWLEGLQSGWRGFRVVGGASDRVVVEASSLLIINLITP
jgi:hypothetical protein